MRNKFNQGRMLIVGLRTSKGKRKLIFKIGKRGIRKVIGGQGKKIREKCWVKSFENCETGLKTFIKSGWRININMVGLTVIVKRLKKI